MAREDRSKGGQALGIVGLSTVIEAWAIVRQVDANVTPDRLRKRLQNAKIAVPLSYIRTKRGLGIAARLAIIRQVLGFGDSLYKEINDRMPPSGLPLKVQQVRHVLQWGHATKYQETWLADVSTVDVVIALASALNERIAHKGGKPITAIDLFVRPFDGANAPTDFHDWIAGFGRSAPVGLELLPTERSGDTKAKGEREGRFRAGKVDARKSLVEDIQNWIENSPAERPILNAHCEDMWSGLTALAATIIDWATERRGKDRIDVCYLPCSRRTPTDVEHDFPWIVAYLHAFFHDVPLLEAAAPTSAEETIRKIHEIRRQMLVRPALLIFDGYVAPPPVLGALVRHIRDDSLPELIGMLIEPPLCSHAEPVSLETFGRNRIVVLSNTGMEGFYEKIDHRPIAPPHRTDVDEILKAQGLRNLPEIEHLRTEIQALGSVKVLPSRLDASEAVFQLIDVNISLRRYLDLYDHGRFEAQLRQINWAGLETASARRVLTGLLIKTLDDHRHLWITALLLIAVAPAGMRPLSVRRLLAEWHRVGFGKTTRLPGGASPSETLQSLDEMMEVLRAILVQGRFDRVEGLDDIEHPYEFRTPPGASGELADPDDIRSINFTIPELREDILTLVHESRGRNAIRAAHLIVAEEAIRQQTIIFRHSKHVAGGSIRPFRRLIQALYHGALSLPPLGYTGPSVSHREFATPSDPSDAWIWLSLFLYRRILERPPAWQVTRLYGADGIKLELVELLKNPAAYWTPLSDGQGRESGMAHLADPSNPLGDSARVQVDLHTSQALAAYALGDTEDCQEALKNAEGILTQMLADAPADRRATSIARHAKRPVDLLILTHKLEDARALVFDCLALFEGATEAISRHVQSMVAKYGRVFEGGNFRSDQDLEKILKQNGPASAGVGDHGLRRDFAEVCGDNIENVSDLLFRLGEIEAIEADSRFGEYLRQQEADKSAAAKRRNAARRAEINRQFLDAFAYFKLAEETRLSTFRKNPLGQHFFASGHSARVMIRVALRLEREARLIARPRGTKRNSAGYFGRQARKMADTVARHLFRYDRERASMLIIEATIARLLSVGISELSSLKTARKFLDRAEPLVLSLGLDARVRMRLSLERAKVHRRLAEIEIDEDGDLEAAGRYLEFAKFDTEALERNSQNQRLQLWLNIAISQRNRQDEVTKKHDTAIKKRREDDELEA